MILNKRGVSGIVATVIMIAMVIGAVSVVWVIVNNMIGSELEESGSCFGIFEQVTLNGRYTCFNSSSNQFQFSLSIGDLDVDEIVIGISGAGTTTSMKISNVEQTIPNVLNYPSGTNLIKLPSKNGGLTYVLTGVTSKPDAIKIAPIIKKQQCEESDQLTSIDNCFVFS